MGLVERLKNIKNKIKCLEENIKFSSFSKKLLAWLIFTSSPLLAPLSYHGIIHNRDLPKQDSVIVKVWTSSPSQPVEYDTTDWLGRWAVVLDASNPGDTVYLVGRRVDADGTVWKVKLKDIGDGLGYMPDVWINDSALTALYPDSHKVTFCIWDVIDTVGWGSFDTLTIGSNQYAVDTTLKIYATIYGKTINQDTMIVDTLAGSTGVGVGIKFEGDTLMALPHYYDVLLPIKGLHHLDTFKIVLYKIKPGTNEDTVYETVLDSLVYDTTDLGIDGFYFGDAYVWHIPGQNQQYDTLYFPDTIYTIPHGSGIVEEYTSFTAMPIYSNNAIKLKLDVKKEKLKKAELEKLVKNEESRKYTYLASFYENGSHSYIDKKPIEGLNKYRAIIEYIKNNELKADTIKTEIYYRQLPLKIVNVKDGFIIKGMPKEKITIYDVSGRRLKKVTIYGNGKLKVKAKRGIYFIKSNARRKSWKGVRF